MNKIIFVTVAALAMLASIQAAAIESPKGIEAEQPALYIRNAAPSPFKIEAKKACLPNGTACQSDGSWGNCCSGFCYQWDGYSHGFCQ